MNAVDSPRADDPGALTRSEVTEDRRQAAPRNLLFDAGEELDQQTLGLAYKKTFNTSHQLMLRNYYVSRDFRSNQPFDINSNGQGGGIRLDRWFAGAGANYTYFGSVFDNTNELVLGFDFDAQRDQRKRYANSEGQLGEQTTDQDEDVTSLGVYFQDATELIDRVTLTFGARYDDVRYDVDDHTSGNGSGDISFSQMSPMLGVVWSVSPAVNLYGNIARSFDPPTTTELANPTGTSGFNSDLQPQTATNYEIGAKGLLPGRARYEIAIFDIDVDDELVGFELSGAGQTFFENAGSSTHRGIESALTLKLLPSLSGTVAYTYSNFTFDRFRDRSGNNFEGNKIPGVPDHQFHVEMNYQHPAGLFASGDLLYASSFYADNANTVRSGAFAVANLRAGVIAEWDRWELSPFLGVNNVFDEEYFDNVRLNSGNGRYYEPAPERNIYGGVTVRYNFYRPSKN